MQEQMFNVSKEVGNLRKDQREILEIKNTVREMKNIFDGLISRLDTNEETISEFASMSIETSKTEKSKEEKKTKKKEKPHRTEYPKTIGQL